MLSGGRAGERQVGIIRNVLVMVVLAAGVAACGGSPAVQQAGPPSIAQVAAAHGLTITDHVGPGELYVSDSAICTDRAGRKIELVTFASDTLRDNWVRVAGQFAEIVFTGPGYAASLAPG
jgi:hypothetical protein